MSPRRTRAVAGSRRRKAGRSGGSECANPDHRPTPDSDRSDRLAALPRSFTSGITRPVQSPTDGCALRDEDLHSFPATSLAAALHPHQDIHVLRAGQPCTCTSGLPVPRLLPPIPRSDLFCTVTPIDDRGRLADRSPIRAAGWRPGQPVTISMTDDHSVVIIQASGPETITRHGHLRLPMRVRHACRLSTGDRLLVAATTTQLMVYPMATVEAALQQLATRTT